MLVWLVHQIPVGPHCFCEESIRILNGSLGILDEQRLRRAPGSDQAVLVDRRKRADLQLPEAVQPILTCRFRVVHPVLLHNQLVLGTDLLGQ